MCRLFSLLYTAVQQVERLSNRGLLLICVETPFQNIHTQQPVTVSQQPRTVL